MAKYLDIGTINKGYNKKDPNGNEIPDSGSLYLKLKADLDLSLIEPGACYAIDNILEGLDRLCELGYIKEGDLEARKEKVPPYMIYAVKKKTED